MRDVQSLSQESTMCRRAIGVAAIVLALWTAANSAMAKGIERAHFTGPGLPAEGVTLIRARAISQVGLVAPKWALSALGVARADLGTAYRARYRMDYAPRHVFRQIVYPYAKGGPITFTPRGQHIGQDHESFRGGWYAARPCLLRLLVTHGFPSHDPVDHDQVMSDHDDEQNLETTGSASQASGPGVFWGLAVGGTLAVIAVATGALNNASQRRRAN
jgi:hypothetical protein